MHSLSKDLVAYVVVVRVSSKHDEIWVDQKALAVKICHHKRDILAASGHARVAVELSKTRVVDAKLPDRSRLRKRD